MKIPDPMIEPTMIEIPLTSPIFGFSATISMPPSSSFLAASTGKSSASDRLRVGLYPFTISVSADAIAILKSQRIARITCNVDAKAAPHSQNEHTRRLADATVTYVCTHADVFRHAAPAATTPGSNARKGCYVLTT